jgi:hypothetical protein
MYNNKELSTLSLKLGEAQEYIQKAEKILIKEGMLSAKSIADFRRIFNYLKECRDEEICRKSIL